MVDMDAGRRLRRHAGRAALSTGYATALQVVEYEHPAGTGHLGDETLGLRIIDPAHFVLVPEIADPGTLLDEREALPVERHFRGNRPHVVDPHPMRLVCHVGGRRLRAGIVSVVA